MILLPWSIQALHLNVIQLLQAVPLQESPTEIEINLIIDVYLINYRPLSFE